jgi:hypothetical protein
LSISPTDLRGQFSGMKPIFHGDCGQITHRPLSTAWICHCE